MRDSLEPIYFIASIVLAANGWVRWYRDAVSVNRLAVRWPHRIILLGAPILCMAILFWTLSSAADIEVRKNFFYFGYYMVLGAGWLAAVIFVIPFMGVSARDDALERANHSAGWAVAGALLGAIFAFSGANIGNGPGVEAVLFSALLSTGLFFVLWAIAEWFGSFGEEITVERNLGSGIRLGGFLSAAGLLCGWAVAGDWVSARTTLRDFVWSCWPAMLLSACVIVIEASRRLAKQESAKGSGGSIALAVIYIASAAAWVMAHGFH